VRVSGELPIGVAIALGEKVNEVLNLCDAGGWKATNFLDELIVRRRHDVVVSMPASPGSFVRAWVFGDRAATIATGELVVHIEN
jgi:hypothetical protein